MIKIEYKFRTKGPLHTGSDVNAGTLRSLRRQKCILADPVVYESCLSPQARREAVCNIALCLWYAIDKDGIKGKRLMGIWDEFANKLIAASRASNKFQFLENIFRAWGIESVSSPALMRAIDALSDHELLDTVRNETQYVVLKTRYMRDQAQAKKDTEGGWQAFLFNLDIEKKEPHKIMRTQDMIPCVSGNSFRGKIRRLVMRDFCQRAGIAKLEKRVYHTFFTGGFLDQSTAHEDFDKMESFVNMNPMLGVLGAAIGNMTIEGDLKMGWAYPICRERGTGDESYWNYIDTVFQTRHGAWRRFIPNGAENDRAGRGRPDTADEIRVRMFF